MVSALVGEILTYATTPFAFFGHSMGALIAFELTRKLRAVEGVLPVHLLVSASRAPQLSNTKPKIHNLGHDEFIKALRRFNGTPLEVLESEELMELMLPALRADFALCETYEYESGPPLDIPISVFGGSQDQDIGRDELVQWQDQTTGTFTLRFLPGDHFFLQAMQPELLDAVAFDVMSSLAAQSRKQPAR
jgi:surfactin synthase thioesterase subunit